MSPYIQPPWLMIYKTDEEIDLVSNSLLRYLYLHVPLKIYLGWGTHFNETACWKVKSIRIKMGTRLARWRSLVKDVALWVSSVRNKKNKKSKWSEVHHSINSWKVSKFEGVNKKMGLDQCLFLHDWKLSLVTDNEALKPAMKPCDWPMKKPCDRLQKPHDWRRRLVTFWD